MRWPGCANRDLRASWMCRDTHVGRGSGQQGLPAVSQFSVPTLHGPTTRR